MTVVKESLPRFFNICTKIFLVRNPYVVNEIVFKYKRFELKHVNGMILLKPYQSIQLVNNQQINIA